jgi:undecaprenyl-diphosphatase
MNNFLEEIDRQIITLINSWNTPLLDEIMWIVSAKLTWIPLYLFLLFLAYRKLDRKTFFLFIGFVCAAVVLADLVSVHAFKNVFLRFRPSHNLILTNKLHYYEMASGEFYKGGKYGFVSSHAANFLAIASSSLLVLNRFYPTLKWLLLFVGLAIGYSRLYLGVHYLSDVIVGGLLGFCISLLLFKVFFQPLARKKVS